MAISCANAILSVAVNVCTLTPHIQDSIY